MVLTVGNNDFLLKAQDGTIINVITQLIDAHSCYGMKSYKKADVSQITESLGNFQNQC